MEDSNSYCQMDVALRILIHDNKTLALNIERHSDARQVFMRVVEEIKLSAEASRYCALFELVDGIFERKLHDRECPHNIVCITHIVSQRSSKTLIGQKGIKNISIFLLCF